MVEVVLKVTLLTLVVSAGVGALASLLVIVARVADTRLGKSMLNTRAGKRLLRTHAVNYLAHRLVYNQIQFWDSLTDADFSKMAHDQDYQKEAKALADAFARADWEAFQIGEQFQ